MVLPNLLLALWTSENVGSELRGKFHKLVLEKE